MMAVGWIRDEEGATGADFRRGEMGEGDWERRGVKRVSLCWLGNSGASPAWNLLATGMMAHLDSSPSISSAYLLSLHAVSAARLRIIERRNLPPKTATTGGVAATFLPEAAIPLVSCAT